ncbi:oligosaccharide flippase family protein [Pedobacter steynii]|nr:oligosaccharide flippase family protein [Pedobacter steynii]
MNMIRTGSNLLFPIVVFPYVVRVLGVEGISLYDTANSLIGYLTIIASLGVGIYGVREIGRVKEDSVKRSTALKELLTINTLAAIVTYVFLLFFLYFSDNQHLNTKVVLVLSLLIFFTSLSADWYFVGVEKQAFITIRGVIIKVVIVMMVFLFVNDKSDLLIYATLMMLLIAITSLVNIYFLVPVFKVKAVDFNLKKHIGPMVSSLLINSCVSYFGLLDVVILSEMGAGDEIAYYTLPLRVFKIVSVVITSTSMVFLPRVAGLLSSDKTAFDKINRESISFILFTSLGFALFLFTFSGKIIQLFGGTQFADSALSLKVLAFTLIGACFTNLMTFQVFYSQQKSKAINLFYLSCIVLNILIIVLGYKHFGYIIIAYSYLASIFILALLQGLYNRFYTKNMLFEVEQLKYILAFALSILLSLLIKNVYLSTVISAITYLLILKLTKEKLVFGLLDSKLLKRNKK